MWPSSVVLALALAGGLSAAPLDQKEVEFGQPGGTKLYLDLHVPHGPGPFPAAILVHGGGFDEGSRSTNVRPLFEPLANAGFAWFSIDYRMAPKFKFVQANEDLNTAIKWVKAHAREYPGCWLAVLEDRSGRRSREDAEALRGFLEIDNEPLKVSSSPRLLRKR